MNVAGPLGWERVRAAPGLQSIPASQRLALGSHHDNARGHAEGALRGSHDQIIQRRCISTYPVAWLVNEVGGSKSTPDASTARQYPVSPRGQPIACAPSEAADHFNADLKRYQAK